MEYGWLMVIIVLIVIELATVNLTTIWFIVSAVAALIASLFTDIVIIQFAIFVILGVVLIITTKKTLIKLLEKDKVPTNLDRIIGMSGIILKDTDKLRGEIKVDGKVWGCISNDKISTDAYAEVEEIIGNKLKVKKVEE